MTSPITPDAGGHTPGPWSFRPLKGEDGLGYIVADAHDIIHAGVADLSREENEANARLIAAAPDLLAELERAIIHLDEWARYHSLEATTETWAILHCARATIAKAKGQAS